jgi:tetratricopeptide (TPR) repeat protein
LFKFTHLGRNEKAIEAYDKALGIKPDDADAWYNKGNALFYLGRKDKAISAYENALTIFEELKSPYAEMLRESLAKLKSEK